MSAPNTDPLEDRLRNMILHRNEPPPSPSDPLLNSTGAVSQAPPPQGALAGVPAGPANQRAPRKRLNQAQRRQLSAELTIPVHHSRRPAPPNSYGQGRGQALGGPQQYSTGTQPGAAMSFPGPPRHQQNQSYHVPPRPPFPDQQDWRRPRFAQGGPPPPMVPSGPLPPSGSRAPRTLYNPGRSFYMRPEVLKAQSDMLEELCNTIIAGAEIEPSDILEKENFRIRIEQAVRATIARFELDHYGHAIPDESVQLRCFGSLSSGFATKAADMDLGLLSPLSHIQPDDPASPIPRLIEKTLLDMGFGARLLTRTRVPIIKICEKPSARLRQDLLRERAKWEAGMPDDVEDEGALGDQHQSSPGSPVEEKQSANKLLGEKGSSEDGGKATAERPLEKVVEEQAHAIRPPENGPQQSTPGHETPPTLKQGEGRSLASYYDLAIRWYGRIGIRDFTKQSHLDEFGDDELWHLNEACLAFVDGLADEAIRQRLMSSATLNRKDLVTNRFCRSLQGVYYQVEGETLVKQWEESELRDKNTQHEQLEERRVAEWRALQNATALVRDDPLGFVKRLLAAYEGLRSMPTVRISTLEQAKFESAAKYHQRIIDAMQHLGARGVRPGDDYIVALAIRQYVTGIHNQDIRQAVKEFTGSTTRPTLQAIAQKHKGLQLAHEYEKAINKKLYPEEHVPTIKAYVDILRGPVSDMPPADGLLDAFIPIPPGFLPAMNQIRQLGDPALLAPNQPRDHYLDHLEFPKSGAGVQCDINFSAHLALQNTLLLRCYSFCDPRVRPLVLFVKHWAKVRQINTPYRGTLSSYGYVLMMLHYLVNIAEPFVCPNLQQLGPPKDFPDTSVVVCKGRDVRFWRDEAEIKRLAAQNALTQNHDSVGTLLRGFFEYYAQLGPMSTINRHGFHWGRDVLSLRTPGGLLTKNEKGWTGAKTVIEVKHLAAPPPGSAGLVLSPGPSPGLEQQQQHQTLGPLSPSVPATHSTNIKPPLTASPPRQDQAAKPATMREVKEVRHRFLFAIEDPFELDHNVARTVTHYGIIAIRDEFRRAWRMIQNAGSPMGAGGGAGRQGGQFPTPNADDETLFSDISEAEARRDRKNFARLLSELHGTTAGK